jgi:hypothetical protein
MGPEAERRELLVTRATLQAKVAALEAETSALRERAARLEGEIDGVVTVYAAMFRSWGEAQPPAALMLSEVPRRPVAGDDR